MYIDSPLIVCFAVYRGGAGVRAERVFEHAGFNGLHAARTATDDVRADHRRERRRTAPAHRCRRTTRIAPCGAGSAPSASSMIPSRTSLPP